MKPIFIDTSFLIALVLTDDALHQRAIEWQRLLPRPLFTTEFIMLEFFDALASERLRTLAVETELILRSDLAIQIFPASTALVSDGISLFKSRLDKSWGLTDCISFEVMKDSGAVDALTADHHFEQAGFNALLRYDPK